MPNGTQYDLSSAVQDPDFLKADMRDKINFLSAHDSDFASANVKDKLGYLNHILTTGQQFQQENQGKSYYGFTPSNLAQQGWQGVKELAGSIGELTKDIGSKSWADLGKKYITDPADVENAKAQNAKTSSESIGHSVAAAIPLVGPWAASLGEQAGRGDIGGAGARGGAQVAVGAMAKPVVKATGVLGGMAREGIGGAIHTPEGDLTPGAKIAGQVGGGIIGTGVGTAVGHPYIGAGAGYKMGPEILDKIFPEPAEISDKRALADFYQAKAEDLMRRGREQALLDKKAEFAARAAAKNAPPPNPFAGMTSTATSIGNTPVPEVPKGNPTPFQQAQATFVDKFKVPTPSKGLIIDPNNIPADEVTHVSVPWNELKKMAMGGDKYAIDEVIRRGRQAEIPGLSEAIGKAKPYPKIGNQR